ncbi:MAG: hypothetical protein ABW004_16975 [Aeromicrobium sp.]
MPEPTADEPRTRAELLTRQRAALTQLSRRRWAVRRLVLPVVVSLAACFVVFLGADAPDDDSATGRGVALAVILAAWAFVQWRHVTTTRRLEAERRTWVQADRTDRARSLPPGDLDLETATIWDVRDSADLEKVAGAVGFGRQAVIYDARPFVSLFVGMATAMIATIAFVVAVVDDPIAGGDRIIAALALGVVALSGWVLTWTSGREYWRRQVAWNQVGLERQVYLERRTVLHGIDTAPDPQLPRWARPLAAFVVLVLVVLIVARVASASAAVLLVTVAILLVAALLIGIAVVRAQRLHVVPLRSGGPDVLSSPGRFVRADVTDRAVTITDVAGEAAPAELPVDAIRHLGSLTPTYPWVPGPVLVITDDDVVVLAGRGTDDLRQRLDQHISS